MMIGIRDPLASFPTESGQSSQGPEAHGLHRCGRHNDHGAFLAQSLIDHVHGSKVEGDAVSLVVFRCFGEFLRDLGFRRAQDDAALALPFRLGLTGHGVLQAFGNDDVTDLYRLYGDSPGVGLLAEDLLNLLAQPVPLREQYRQVVLPDGVTQGGLGCHDHRFVKVLDLKNRLLRIPHHPERDGVHTYGDRVGGERRFGAEIGDPDSLVHELGHLVHNRNDNKQARLSEAPELAKPKEHRPFPLVGDLDGGGHEQPNDERSQQDLAVRPEIEERGQAGGGAEDHDGLPYLGPPQENREAQGQAERNLHRLHGEFVNVQMSREPGHGNHHQEQNIEGGKAEIGTTGCSESLEGDRER